MLLSPSSLRVLNISSADSSSWMSGIRMSLLPDEPSSGGSSRGYWKGGPLTDDILTLTPVNITATFFSIEPPSNPWKSLSPLEAVTRFRMKSTTAKEAPARAELEKRESG